MLIVSPDDRPYIGHDHGWFDDCTPDCVCSCPGPQDVADGICRKCERKALERD